MTNDLRLRDVLDADLPVFFENQRDAEASLLVGFTPRDQEAFDAHWAKIRRDPSNVIKTILFGGRVAGNVLSFDRDGKREVGYWIGRDFWGKGVATRALAEFLQHEPARPLHGFVAKHNVASLRVLEKCGFAPCGEIPQPPAGGGGAGGEPITLSILRLDA
jgi:RimJ/RimL family protein N-acetyltransferase